MLLGPHGSMWDLFEPVHPHLRLHGRGACLRVQTEPASLRVPHCGRSLSCGLLRHAGRLDWSVRSLGVIDHL